jgi:hypothetical protein
MYISPFQFSTGVTENVFSSSRIPDLFILYTATVVYMTDIPLFIAENDVSNSCINNPFYSGLYSRSSGIDVVGILVIHSLLRSSEQSNSLSR